MAELDPGPWSSASCSVASCGAFREAVKIGTEDAAAALGWYRAKVSKVETGTVKLTAADLSSLLTLYKADRLTSERLQRLGEVAGGRLCCRRFQRPEVEWPTPTLGAGVNSSRDRGCFSTLRDVPDGVASR
ncbi:MAG TPA: helix-turn-helix transcriptional regulator [Pseudonocardiaceae bacterium]